MALLGRAAPAPILGPGLWSLESRFDPKVVSACKLIPGLRWNANSRRWTGYHDAMVALKAVLAEYGEVQLAPPPAPFDVGGNVLPLRPYQVEAVRFLLTEGPAGALLGDEMGLGKTASALGAAGHVGRLLVVCPSYVRGVWRSELGKWAKGRVPFFPEGIKGEFKLPDCDTIVIHYDILHAWASRLSLWLSLDKESAVCFDEAHMLQSEASKRAKAAREVALQARYRWGLTGTPLTNRPRDLWNTVDVLSPGRFGKFFGFGLRHCDAHQEQVSPEKVVWTFKGASNLEELRLRASTFMLRRTVQDVGLQLPPKTRQLVWLDGPKRRPREGAPASFDGASLRRELDGAADRRLPQVWELLKGHLEAGLGVVCFTWRRAIAEALAARCSEGAFECELVHGGVSHARRGLAIERARGWTAGGLLVATIDSASVGVDFTFASVVVFGEVDYKPQALLQAEARAHRFGASRPVLIQYALEKGGIDEAIASIVIAKLDVVEAALGGAGDLAADLRGNEADLMGELMGAIEAMKGST